MIFAINSLTQNKSYKNRVQLTSRKTEEESTHMTRGPLLVMTVFFLCQAKQLTCWIRLRCGQMDKASTAGTKAKRSLSAASFERSNLARKHKAHQIRQSGLVDIFCGKTPEPTFAMSKSICFSSKVSKEGPHSLLCQTSSSTVRHQSFSLQL